MSNRSKATFHEGGIIFDPRKIAEPTPIRMGEAIETLEGLRDTVAAQHWANPSAQHSVLYGIRMCIHALKQKPETEHNYRECPDPWKCTQHQKCVTHSLTECLDIDDCYHAAPDPEEKGGRCTHGKYRDEPCGVCD